MLDSIEDYEWKPADKDAHEKTLINMDQDLLYIEDTYSNGLETTQTELQDWKQDRYQIKHRKNYQPPETEDQTLATATTWNEAEQLLEQQTQP